MEISTGQDAEEGGERGGAKAAVKVGDEAGLGKAAEVEECSARGGRGNGDYLRTILYLQCALEVH